MYVVCSCLRLETELDINVLAINITGLGYMIATIRGYMITSTRVQYF